jgi:hypothetical protein
MAVSRTIAACDENGREGRDRARKLSLEINARLSVQMNVQYQANRLLRIGVFMELGN